MKNNETYLILGASSDLGICLIKKINDIYISNEEPPIIIAHYVHDSEELQNLVQSCSNVRLIMRQADLSDINTTRTFIQGIKNDGLKASYVVNFCANCFQYTRMTEWDSEVVNRDMTIQVYSFAEILKEILPEMAEQKFGKIVAVLTSYTIGMPPKNLAGYVTVKYALLGLIKSVASDYGHLGINVNGISPDMINTKFLANVGRKIKEFSAASNIRGRLLEPEDVLPTIMLLLSNDSTFINGSNLNLSGHSE